MLIQFIIYICIVYKIVIVHVLMRMIVTDQIMIVIMTVRHQ